MAGKMNGNTVSLATLVTVVSSVVAGAYWIDQRFDRLEETCTVMKMSMQNRWSSVDQMNWSHDLEVRNPSLVVPDPRDTLERASHRGSK